MQLYLIGCKTISIKLLMTLMFILVFIRSVGATAQYPDKIIYEGREYAMQTNPMEAYFDKYPDSKPRKGIMSTALWRGYIATFEIKQGQLFVKDIKVEVRDTSGEVKFATKWISVLKEVFAGEEAVKVDWLTGLLVIPHGKLVQYIHMGYASTYEKYIILELDKGNLTKEKKLKYKQYVAFKDKQFLAFKETEEYKKMVAQLKEENYSDEHIASFLRDYVLSYTSKIIE